MEKTKPSKAPHMAAIIRRIEDLRGRFNINKSRFCEGIGMKPQTYNNFIGAQGSKPNVELILGVMQAYGVEPRWLLTGEGPVFAEGDYSAAATPLGDLPEAKRMDLQARVDRLEHMVDVLVAVYGSKGWQVLEAQHAAAHGEGGKQPKPNGGAA